MEQNTEIHKKLDMIIEILSKKEISMYTRLTDIINHVYNVLEVMLHSVMY